VLVGNPQTAHAAWPGIKEAMKKIFEWEIL
jgi:hypothetical protein